MSTTTLPKNWRDEIEKIALRVSTPGQYLGGEVNMCLPDWSDTSSTRFCLAFPDTYGIGMSNQGVKILYHLVNDAPGMLCERAFCPWTDMESLMRARGIPAFSLENHVALSEFDSVGFSIQNETSLTNILTMLDLGGIPLEASERGDSDPIVVTGGTGAVSPEPIADFIDLNFIGEGEEILPAFLILLGGWRGRKSVAEVRDALGPFSGKDNRKDLYATPPLGARLTLLPENLQELSRAEFIELCAQMLPGCYAPSLYEARYDEEGVLLGLEPIKEGVPARIRKNTLANLNDAYYPIKQIVPYVECVHDRVTLEIMRGCTEGCRYCQAGMIDRPQRYRTPEKIAELAGAILKETGYDEIALLSLSSSDHPQLFQTMDLLYSKFAKDNISISLPSLRVDHQLTKLPKITKNVRKGGLTMAPETGSERLRRVINKTITQEDLLNGAETAFREGWKTIKFYFMLGLPTENDDDVRETAELLNEIAWMARDMKKNVRINVTVSLFVPKAFTPFQWEPLATEEELEHRIALLKSLMQHRNIKLKFHSYNETWLEALLSRGDRRLGRVVKRAWELGARFDAWHEHFKREAWDQAMREAGLTEHFYLHRVRSKDEVMPWDHLSVGTSKRHLWEERMRSRLEQYTNDCSGHTPGCIACGVDPLTCRTGLEQEHDEMNPEMKKRERVRYADNFKARQAQREELAAAEKLI